MTKLLTFLGRQPRSLLLVLYILLTISVGVADYVTHDISVVLFYIVPIFLAVWTVDRPVGILLAVLSGVEGLILNSLLRPDVPLLSVRSWNALTECVFLVFAGYVLARLKTELDQKKKHAEDLEAANEELAAFNYSIAHDLRRPLTSVSGYCQFIQRYARTLDQESREMVDKAYGETVRMNQLITALLNFANLSKSELRMEDVDLTAIAKSIAQDLQRGEPGRNVQVEISEGLHCTGDPRLLAIVLENLIGNAWKYTSRQVEARISFGVELSEGRTIYQVRDNGIGFDAAHADKLFSPFQRLNSAQDFAGFGIGLATVDRIIKRHGGKIWAKAEEGKGAVFYFTLPQP